jgi:hypothetical protein
MFEFAGNQGRLHVSGSTVRSTGTTVHVIFCTEQTLPGSTTAVVPLTLQERYYRPHYQVTTAAARKACSKVVFAKRYQGGGGPVVPPRLVAATSTRRAVVPRRRPVLPLLKFPIKKWVPVLPPGSTRPVLLGPIPLTVFALI